MKDDMPHFGEKKWSRFVPYNAKIADINHPDILQHFLDLAAALPETRKIIAVMLAADRVVGTGYLLVFPNEGANSVILTLLRGENTIIIADGTQRLQYRQDTANDDFDLFCMGYVVEV